MQSGVVEGIYIAPAIGSKPEPVEEAQAVAGRGLEGDRYFNQAGTFYVDDKDGQDLTLIEAEAIERLASENGIDLAAGDARRNVVTRGLALNDLVGRRFTVGAVECHGRRLCDPCAHLESATQPGVLQGLAGRGGLRADIVSGGTIAVGAPVRELEG
jgi:MOSC domain-containing protein YiiM